MTEFKDKPITVWPDSTVYKQVEKLQQNISICCVVWPGCPPKCSELIIYVSSIDITYIWIHAGTAPFSYLYVPVAQRITLGRSDPRSLEQKPHMQFGGGVIVWHHKCAKFTNVRPSHGKQRNVPCGLTTAQNMLHFVMCRRDFVFFVRQTFCLMPLEMFVVNRLKKHHMPDGNTLKTKWFQIVCKTCMNHRWVNATRHHFNIAC